jgi:TM2 domain-containing membrane protein YozV
MRIKSKSIIKYSLFIWFLSFKALSFSQNSADCDLRFINHLVNRGNYTEALFLLDSTACASNQINDTVFYLRGWSLYSLKQLLKSSENLIRVSASSQFYLKSHFFAAYNYTHIGNYDIALRVLSDISLSTDREISLKNLELAGIFLLQGNQKKFDESASMINRNQYEISESYDNLQGISINMKTHKKKSPLVAGLLSGIIPGSGKFYSGKKGEAITTFISTVGLGLVTAESIRKQGVNSFSTIAFGTAFAFSYVANIYGAVITVNIIETEYNDNVKNSILFNLHIPIRNTFDR